MYVCVYIYIYTLYTHYISQQEEERQPGPGCRKMGPQTSHHWYGGQVVEDIDGFNRLSLMLTDLMPEDDQHDIACEGFGNFDFVKGEVAQAADEYVIYCYHV